MFRSLLLAIDYSEYSYVTTRYAVEWARALGAHVTILSVLDQKEIAMVYPFIYPQDDIAIDYDADRLGSELRDRQRSQAEEAVSKAERACNDAGVAYSSIIEEGIVAQIILNYTVDRDLLFIGQRGSGAEHNSGLLGSNLESVVRQIHRPVLITPHSYRPFVDILAAYDGSFSAIEALHAVVGLFDSWKPAPINGPEAVPHFHLLVVDHDDEVAQTKIERAKDYLHAYHVNYSIVKSNGDPADAILHTAEEMDVDLVAMGAFGHSRVRAMLLGSTTEQVLRRIDRPLLLIH